MAWRHVSTLVWLLLWWWLLIRGATQTLALVPEVPLDRQLATQKVLLAARGVDPGSALGFQIAQSSQNDARRDVAAEKFNTPVFSSSSLRFAKVTQEARNGAVGKVANERRIVPDRQHQVGVIHGHGSEVKPLSFH